MPPVLRLNDGEMISTLRKAVSTAEALQTTSKIDPTRAAKLEQYTPFSGRQFAGSAGVPDLLPNISDGELTLLNAKADRFAVFVRRVALQVFGALRRSNWQDVPFREVASLHDMVTVEAILSPKGKLVSTRILDRSGSALFDRVVESSARDGVWDQNPPSAAVADDGNIHFIFKSRTWARRRPDGVPEQRWLVLATGLL